jgi:hypothetical protein
MKNLSTSTQPEGNALPSILDKWINEVQMKVMQEKNLTSVEFDNPLFVSQVEREITNVISKMDELTGGFDFARILTQYFRGFVKDNQDLQRRTLRWLRGEYGTRTEAKTDLGVRDIIDDNNWYN